MPLRYNDNRPIEPEKFLQTKSDLVRRFGAVTVDPQPAEGTWTHQGTTYEDTSLKFTVDVAQDSPEVRAFFKEFKEMLKERFDQLDIWIVAVPIEII